MSVNSLSLFGFCFFQLREHRIEMRALADEYLTEHDGEDEAEGSAEKNVGKIVRANHNAAYRNQRRVAYRANPKKSFRQFFVPEREQVRKTEQHVNGRRAVGMSAREALAAVVNGNALRFEEKIPCSVGFDPSGEQRKIVAIVKIVHGSEPGSADRSLYETDQKIAEHAAYDDRRHFCKLLVVFRFDVFPCEQQARSHERRNRRGHRFDVKMIGEFGVCRIAEIFHNVAYVKEQSRKRAESKHDCQNFIESVLAVFQPQNEPKHYRCGQGYHHIDRAAADCFEEQTEASGEIVGRGKIFALRQCVFSENFADFEINVCNRRPDGKRAEHKQKQAYGQNGFGFQTHSLFHNFLQSIRFISIITQLKKNSNLLPHRFSAGKQTAIVDTKQLLRSLI